MRAGKLRRRVDIEQPLLDQNAIGELEQTWSTFAANVPAQVEPLSGRERIVAQQLNTQLDTRVTLRYISGLTTKMRIKYARTGYTPRYLQIEAFVNLDERNREIVVDCTESEDGGQPIVNSFLLENGDALLLEDGTNLLLEA
jgi:SPP1 family predicted phage head-tail adaptor